ncbi:MAG: hypothetical protein HY329_23940, partial [Chloroflexi bacterium]|nr:hypothetical protein [Chloroflexota bacterium]
MTVFAAALGWLVVVEIVGLLAAPLAYRLFAPLADRGYAFAKPLGLVVAAYGLWLASSFGLIGNTTAGAVLALVGLAALSGWLIWSRRDEALAYFRNSIRRVLFIEAVGVVTFAVGVLYRSYDPEISHTEQPMELTFLNGILASERLPPQDPWMSGHSISYYYFGYFIVAQLVRLAGVPAAVGFNLALATIFALTVTGAFGLGYNLVASGHCSRTPDDEHTQREVEDPEDTAPAHEEVILSSRRPAIPLSRRPTQSSRPALVAGGLSAVLLAICANLEAVFEVMRRHGLVEPAFWRWLDVDGLQRPIPGFSGWQLLNPTTWLPTDPPDTWWWFRATRVIGTYVSEGAERRAIDYTITEFPFFSFILGDLHPHVLALPFGLLVVALALSCLLWAERFDLAWLRRDWPLALVAVVCVGALGFLNSWDLPTYAFVFA